MSLPSFSTAIPTVLREVGTPLPPAWVERLSTLKSPECDRELEDFAVGTQGSNSFSRIAIRIPDATSLDAGALREITRESYGEIFRQLSANPAQPIRFWNFLPRIHDQVEDQQTRYMIFNAGRFLAFQDHYGDSRVFDRNVATASAVGHYGTNLWIHCLAATEPAIHLGNPRQISPHRYSARFGQLPPCFARATLLPKRSAVLIAGTASICGEDSLHDDLQGQLAETLQNLAAVVDAARQTTEPGRDGQGFSADEEAKNGRVETPRLREGDLLRALSDLRIYHPRPADLRWLNDQLRQRLGDRPQLEFIQSDLCRAELLVEIEAIADLSVLEGASQ
jgi:enamine deaminase RidA (YjgF/YER057c/UK114 family)